MLRRCLLAQVIALAATGLAGAQLNRTPPRRVELIVHVFYQGEQHPAGAWLTVQLLDGFGTPEGEQATDQEGMARFRTISGIHRLRIIGPGIVEYNGTIDIENVEARRFEIVRVRRKPDPALVSSPGDATISATRLKIPDSARKEFQKGAQALERKDWQEAKRRFETAVTLYPGYDLAHNGLGVAAMSTGDVEAARRAFEKAISLNQNFSGAYRNLARIVFAERKYAEAEVLLARSLENEPLNTWALTFVAYAELLTHKFDKAIVNARKVHVLPHEGFANAHAIAAKALEATGQPEQALAEYQLYLKEDPNGPSAAQALEAVARISNHPSK